MEVFALMISVRMLANALLAISAPTVTVMSMSVARLLA
jgi:hypothetical protein